MPSKCCDNVDTNTVGLAVGGLTTLFSCAFLIREFCFGPPSRRKFTTTKVGQSNASAAPGVECPCRDPRFDLACVGAAVGVSLLIFFKNRHVKSIEDARKKAK